MRIKIKANGEFEKMLCNYFEEFASDTLVEKINSGKKTFDGCWNFIKAEAKKRQKNNCACIPDEVVYGWATHYFEEEEIKEQKNGVAAKVTVSEAQPEEKKDPGENESKPDGNFIDLSDFL